METYGLDFCYIAILKYVEMRRFLAEKKEQGNDAKVDSLIIDAVNRETLNYAEKILRNKIFSETQLMMFLSAIRPQVGGFTDLLFQMDDISLLDYSKLDKPEQIESLYKKAKKEVDKEKKQNPSLITADYYQHLFINFRKLVAGGETKTSSDFSFKGIVWLNYLLAVICLLVFCYILRFF